MRKSGRGFMTVLYTSANLERSDCLATLDTQQSVGRLSVITLLERGRRSRWKCDNALHIMQTTPNRIYILIYLYV